MLKLMSYNTAEKAKELEKLFEKKFFCASKFSQEIESIVKNNKEMTYIDAIIEFCEKNGIDLEFVPKLISKPLKEKLRCEAMNLNFLKKTSRARLIF